MNKIYKGIKSMLLFADYNFEKVGGIKSTEIETEDLIKIQNIAENSITLMIERALNFKGLEGTYIKVGFECIINTEKMVEKEKLIDDIKKGIPVLYGVFSKASLLISQISSMSPFDIIITTPMYNNKKIEVE